VISIDNKIKNIKESIKNLEEFTKKITAFINCLFVDEWEQSDRDKLIENIKRKQESLEKYGGKVSGWGTTKTKFKTKTGDRDCYKNVRSSFNRDIKNDKF
jgi:hypothetical protein